MPGLLRARTPAPTWPTCRPGPCSPTTGRVGRHRAEGVDVAGPWADWCFVLCRTEPGVATPPGPVLPAGADAPAGRRDPADRAADRDVGVQRGLLRRRPLPSRQRGRRGGRRLAGGDGDARLRAGRVDPGPADRLRAGAGRVIAGRGSGPVPAASRPLRQRLADAWIGLRLLRYNALRAMSALAAAGTPGLRRRSPSCNGAPGTGRWPTWAWTCSGPAGAGRRRARTRLFLFTRADTIYGGSNQMQRNIIGERVLGLPEGAGAVSAARLCPRPRAAGRQDVLVTAAAGTGIGFATARGASRRGRPASCCPTSHQRRLAEAVEALTDGRRRAGPRRPV